MMWGYGFNMGWMWLFWALALVIVGLIVFAVVWAVSGATRREASSGQIGQFQARPVRSTSRQILDERCARGELNADEYREYLKVLGEGW